MNVFLKPAISLLNTLRFKAKFILLATIFYLPLLVSFSWIMQEQLTLINQHQQELFGHQQIKNITVLEQSIAGVRSGNTQESEVSKKIQQITQIVSNSDVIREANQQANNLLYYWQDVTKESTNISSEQYQMVYDNSLALRENIAALTGLTRESDALAFYLAETSVQRLPAFIEYIGRTRDLVEAILTEGGFSAQSYTSLVALDKRIDELQVQLKKNAEQLTRVSAGSSKSYLSNYQTMMTSIDNYQKTLHEQLIDPDEIGLSPSLAKKLSTEQYDDAISLLAHADALLGKKLVTQQNTNRYYLWLLALLLAAVILITSYLLIAIYSSLINNVKQINRAAEYLGDGDFTHQLDIVSKDELGDIAHSFSQMQSKIHFLLVGLSNDITQLRSSASDIQQITNEMERSLSKQQDNTHNVAKAITQVSDSVKVIAENTAGAQVLTEQASQHTAQGQEIISDTAKVINDISQEVNTSSVVINSLAKHSTEIGTFVNVIREIADQTNLLALNAAIEAARAGEQGRGFAVVADEVRTLASRTQESTTEIQRIIEQLQAGANESVEAMKKGVVKAEHGVEKTEEVARTFSEVTQNVEQIVNATVQISAAVEQQSTMVVGIDENTVNIAHDADQVMQAAKNAAGAGQDLAKLADHLSHQLAQFTLDKEHSLNEST
ncbi:MAG: methyl-accepting chemotaxis protein [Alteromonadaceae bacterium]|jgi:methyl-accepting chemotaxis protein